MLLLLQSAFLTTDQLKNGIQVQQVLDVSINHLSDQGQIKVYSLIKVNCCSPALVP